MHSGLDVYRFRWGPMSVPFPKSLVSSHYFYTSHAPPGHLGSFLTIFAAPREAGDYLDNLRLELYESREDLKKANRRQRQGPIVTPNPEAGPALRPDHSGYSTIP